MPNWIIKLRLETPHAALLKVSNKCVSLHWPTLPAPYMISYKAKIMLFEHVT